MKSKGIVMRKLLFILIVFFFTSGFYGCLLFHTMSYTINITNDTTGVGTVVVTDIRSDSKGSALETDKKNLFDYVYKSPDFINQMKDEGKNIIHRELYVHGDTLIGKAEFSFNSIYNIEKIKYEDGFYFLTLTLDDSVLNTNGQIIYSSDHKRILWDKNFKTLKFEMLGFPFQKDEYTRLSPFLNPKK
jgi:hypothetical protein